MTSKDSWTAEQHRLAGKRAEDATLWNQAVRDYEAALSLVAAGEAPDENEVELLTSLGRCYWNLSEARTAWRTLRRAISAARDNGDVVGLARATVEILRIWGPPERHRAMAEDALEALGDRDPYLRASLLLGRRWFDDDAERALVEAMAIADRYGFQDLQTIRIERSGWNAMNAGDIDRALAQMERAHQAYARLGRYEPAASVLRGAGFATLTAGRLDRGRDLTLRTLQYAREVHLRFTEQLALLDLVGEAFARCDFNRCRELLRQSPGDVDFRADLYRMWMTELTGDVEGAVRQMVDPERGGGATTAVSQTHCAAAGMLFHAGDLDAARQELVIWADVARQGNSICEELAAISDCVVALADDRLLGDVHAALDEDAGSSLPTVYCTLQGRALGPARGAVALRLGQVAEAEAMYRTGLAWCEAERVPLDAARCHVGLADIARVQGDDQAEASHLGAAAATFEAHNAQLWLERLIAPRRSR